jgi:trehalose-6-phosphate synthase
VRDLIGETTTTFVSPLRRIRRHPAPRSARTARAARHARRRSVRLLIAQVDRIELSKNLLRGFHAYDDLLGATRSGGARWCSAFVYHRARSARYLAYRQEVESVVDRLQRASGTDDWQPIIFDTSDNYRVR